MAHTPSGQRARLSASAPQEKNGTLGAYRGTHLSETSIRAALARAFRATGIPPADLYDYGRHTFASLVALGGAPAWRLREVLGHADIERTLQYISLRDPPPVVSAGAASAPGWHHGAGAQPATARVTDPRSSAPTSRCRSP